MHTESRLSTEPPSYHKPPGIKSKNIKNHIKTTRYGSWKPSVHDGIRFNPHDHFSGIGSCSTPF
jgi:hypothetical protein